MCVCQINYLNEWGGVCVCVSIASGKRQMSHTWNYSASSDSSTLRGSLDFGSGGGGAVGGECTD